MKIGDESSKGVIRQIYILRIKKFRYGGLDRHLTISI